MRLPDSECHLLRAAGTRMTSGTHWRITAGVPPQFKFLQPLSPLSRQSEATAHFNQSLVGLMGIKIPTPSYDS